MLYVHCNKGGAHISTKTTTDIFHTKDFICLHLYDYYFKTNDQIGVVLYSS